MVLKFSMEDGIKMIQPKPYQEIGYKFIIFGWVPKLWLDTGFGMDNRVFLDFIDIDCFAFFGTSADVVIDKSWLSKFRKKSPFYTIINFDQFNIPFIAKSQGRITIKLSGHKDGCQLFLPVIVRYTNGDIVVDPAIIKKHKKIGEMIMQYEKDLKKYNEAWEKIQERRRQKSGISETDESFYSYSHDWEMARGLLDIFGQEGGLNEDYLFQEEDLEEKQLEEKYKDAIEWRGPLLHGTICKMNGFEYRLHSHDHDKHFHIIHRGRGINARFSFPEIELINYKNAKNSICSKEKDKLIQFVKIPENFKRLEREFLRRDGTQTI